MEAYRVKAHANDMMLHQVMHRHKLKPVIQRPDMQNQKMLYQKYVQKEIEGKVEIDLFHEFQRRHDYKRHPAYKRYGLVPHPKGYAKIYM